MVDTAEYHEGKRKSNKVQYERVKMCLGGERQWIYVAIRCLHITTHLMCHTECQYIFMTQCAIAFGSANIQRYYTSQQLIAQLSSVRGETTVKNVRIHAGKLIIS